MLLLIDNYDSFTYNLVNYFAQLDAMPIVHRNDKITVKDALALKPDAVVLSPGPCTPNEAGICLDMVQACHDHNIPMLGVCLGHQSLSQALGGNIVRAPEPVHGKTTQISHDATRLFAHIPSPYTATRYHSLIAEENSLPTVLNITARSHDNLIMALEHKTKPLFGVQFHPESIASDYGHQLLSNFLYLTAGKKPVQLTKEYVR